MTWNISTNGVAESRAKKEEIVKPAHRAGEPPLEYLTRHRWTVTVYRGLVRAHRVRGGYRLVDGPTARALATSLGWYP